MDFLTAYEGERDGHEAIHAIADPTEREIAQLMRTVRLRQMLGELHQNPGDLSDRSKVAFTRALMQGNHSSIEAMDRELARQLDDEEHAVLMLLVA